MKEIIILGIIIVLIILIITLYEHFSISNADNPPTCTGSQVCCDPPTTPQTTPISMFLFKFCWVDGITFPVFADCNTGSGNNPVGSPTYTGTGYGGLTQTSLINHPNNNNCLGQQVIPNYVKGVGMWYLTTDTILGSGILYQYNPYVPNGGAYPRYCYAMLVIDQKGLGAYNNSTDAYTGIVVNYSLSNGSNYSHAQVANGTNTKTIQQQISPAHGESIDLNGFLGCCDLTAWYNSLSTTDKARIGLYTGTIPSLTNSNIRQVDLTTSLPTILGGNNGNTCNYNLYPTCFRNGSIFGATVTSYNYNTSVPGMPYYPFYF